MDKLVEHYKNLQRIKDRDAWLAKKKPKKVKAKVKKKKKLPPRHAKKSDFYKSKEWKVIRYEVLRERGAKCELCGITATDHPLGYVVVDHIEPISKSPYRKLDKSNLQILCNDCNWGKGANYSDDWRPETAQPAKHEDILQWLDE